MRMDINVGIRIKKKTYFTQIAIKRVGTKLVTNVKTTILGVLNGMKLLVLCRYGECFDCKTYGNI